MTKLSPEEKRRETADWTRGLIGLAVVLGLIVFGYMIFQKIKRGSLIQEAKKAKHERVTQNLRKGSERVFLTENSPFSVRTLPLRITPSLQFCYTPTVVDERVTQNLRKGSERVLANAIISFNYV